MQTSLNTLKDLEKSYMKKIIDIADTEKFRNDILNIQNFIRNNYEKIQSYSSEKNKVKIAIERLIRFYFYKNLNVENIYPSPISSDMAIECEDAIINIDAKSIDMIENKGDDKSIHFQKNQINFQNEPVVSLKIYNQYLNVLFPGRLEAYYNDKPVLTYFITINYEDLSKEKFIISDYSICSVPHKDIVESDYENKIISNLKTWGYIDKKEVEINYNNNPAYMPQTNINPNWKEYKYKQSFIWLDETLNHPNQEIGGKVFWKKIDKKFKIVSFGGSARINKEKLKNRKDSEDRCWEGYIKYQL